MADNMKNTRRQDISPEVVWGSSKNHLVIEWFSRLACFLAIVLLLLTIITIRRGKVVQTSAVNIVDDFETANEFFAKRADFGAPTKARELLQQLGVVLGQLQVQAAEDVSLLSATIPDVQRLLNAGKGDVAIGQFAASVGTTLTGAARDLNRIASDAESVVISVNRLLDQGIDGVKRLNSQLAQIEGKVAIVPANLGSLAGN